MSPANNLTQQNKLSNTPPANGQPFKQAQCLRSFFYHLDKLNTLARLIQEAPLSAEQTEAFYEVCYDAMVSASKLDRLSWMLPFDHALRSLSASPAAWAAAEGRKCKEVTERMEQAAPASKSKPEPTSPEPELTPEQLRAIGGRYLRAITQIFAENGLL